MFTRHLTRYELDQHPSWGGCAEHWIFHRGQIGAICIVVTSLSVPLDSRPNVIYYIVLRGTLDFSACASLIPEESTMKGIRVTWVSFLLSLTALGQAAPLCDVSCGPDPSSSTYLANAGSRVEGNNARGNLNPTAPREATVMNSTAGSIQQVIGSQSFNWSIPLVELAGRTGLNLDLFLSYNSRVWDINTGNGDITFNADRDFPSYGFRLDYGYLENDVADNFWILTDSDGSKHQLNLKTTNIWDSVDSTYIELNSSTMVLSYPNGVQVSYQLFPLLPTGSNPLYRPTQITDTNGNFISIAYISGDNQKISTITDTLNRAVTFNYNGSGQLSSITQGTSPNIFTYASFEWGSVPLNYAFTGLTVTDTLTSGTAINVLTRCTLPNETYYTFSYGDWGIVNRIDYFSSSGIRRSYISYNYPTSTAALSDIPTYTQQTISPDGSTQYNWDYTTVKTGDIVSSQSITDPLNTVTTFNLKTTGSCAGTAASVAVSTGSNALRTINDTWTSDASGNNCQLTSATSIFNDSGQQFTNSYTYDANGNMTDEIDRDFDGTVLREIVSSFQPPTANHILNLVSTVQVKDAGGTLRSRTDFAYDGSTVTTVSGASQNNGGSGTRGNLTSVTQYKNAQSGATGGTISETFSFDSLGNVLKAQFDSCTHKSWAYSALTQYTFPDSVTFGSDCGGPQLTNSATYDPASGLLLTSTDPNNQMTAIQYDAFRRPDQVTLPNGTVLYTDYDDTLVSPTVTSRNSVNSLQQLKTADGLGRVIKRQTRIGTSTVVSIVDTAYDALGRVTSVSNPYAPNDTALSTTTAYDPLGRATLVSPPSGGSYQYSYRGNATTIQDPAQKQIRQISDPLGRLIEVDEPALGSLPGTATVTIGGSEQSKTTTDKYCADYDASGRCVDWEFTTTTDYDSGSVSITVNSFTKSVSYGQNDTTSTIASNLASAFSLDGASPVTATASGSTITLQSIATGASTNYPLSTSVTYDTSLFAGPSFTATAPTSLGGGEGPAVTLLTPAITTYSYRPTGELIGVASGAQTRTYAFDDLGRMTSASLPESGTTQYTYFDFGGVQSRTDARGVVTNYVYDGLNRLQQLSYAVGNTGVQDPGAVTYAYGTDTASFNNGRLISMTDTSGSESYSYQQMGWVQQVVKVVNGSTYTIGYGYDGLGDLTQITYPSGRVVSQSYDAIGRLSALLNNGANLLSLTSYNPAQQVTGVSYGNSIASGTLGYNDHLQLVSLAYTSGANTLLNLAYDFGAQNNGQIRGITDSRGAAFSTTYAYDELSRLATAQTNDLTAPNTWALSWTYDRYGNRLSQSLTGGTLAVTQPQLTVDPGTNHITNAGFTYDANGNMTADVTHTYSFDAANHLANVDNGSTAVYTYDGKGYRVAKGTTNYVRSGTEVIAEYSGGTLQKEYVYSGGTLVATIAGTSTTFHYPDHLSNRFETDDAGNVLRTYGHLPFGETWYETGTPDKWKFTVYERDAESGLDCALMRYDSSALGRFMSPDLLGGSIGNPQSLNRYSYVLNDPVNQIDPLGLANCVLNININNNADLTSDQVQQIEARINQVLSSTTDPNGNTVSANFVNSGGDWTLNLSPASPQDKVGQTGYGLGVTIQNPTVYIGSAQSFYQNGWVLGAGTAGAHELVHIIGAGFRSQYPDEPYSQSSGANLMNADSAVKQGVNTNADDTSATPTGFSKPTAQQIAKLFKNCVKKSKKKKKKEAAGGGGGGNDTILPRPGPPSGGSGGDPGDDDDCPNGDCGSHPDCYPNCGGPPPSLHTRASLIPEKIYKGEPKISQPQA